MKNINPLKVKEKRSPTKFAPKAGLVQCKSCSRNFAEERIQTHVGICKKTKSKKRKPFDATKARVEGTEAAQYQGKNSSSNNKNKVERDYILMTFIQLSPGFCDQFSPGPRLKSLTGGGKGRNLSEASGRPRRRASSWPGGATLVTCPRPRHLMSVTTYSASIVSEGESAVRVIMGIY